MAFSYIAFVTILAIVSESSKWFVQAASLGSIARDVRSDRILLDAGLSVGPHRFESNGNTPRLDVPAGGALDLFYRFGFYSLSIRVVPRDDPGTWLIREPTARVFEDNSLAQKERKGSDTFDKQPFQIYLCEDLDELYEAYFQDFDAEGISQPHKLFTGSWRIPIAAKYLGLTPESLTAGHSFVLVKLAREKATLNIGGDLRLKAEAGESLSKVASGNTEAVLDFVQRYGSHYIRDITVGDAIYQAFAISHDQFKNLQGILGSKSSPIGLEDWSKIFETYLAPWLVRETGEVKAASGDNQLQKFLDEELRIQGQLDTYPNLVESLIRKPSLVSKLEALTTNTMSVIGLNLASLRTFVLDPQTRLFFDETINTHSSLFEVNVK